MTDQTSSCTCHARRYGERELVIFLPPQGSAVRPFAYHRGCPKHGVSFKAEPTVDRAVSP